MPAKIARLATRPPYWIPEVSVAVRSSRPSCSKAEQRRIFMADRQSSGESRLNALSWSFNNGKWRVHLRLPGRHAVPSAAAGAVTAPAKVQS